MFFRFSIAAVIVAFLLAIAYKFSDELFALSQDYWALDEAGRKQLLDTVKLVASVLGVFGIIGAFLAKAIGWVRGSKADESAKATQPAVSNKSTTNFSDKVKIKGDYVNGPKTVNHQKGA